MTELADGFNIGGKPWLATEKDVITKWSCQPPGVLFRCAWCGYRFKVGDVVRCVYTNGAGEETATIGGNPFICANCDGPRDEILAKLRAMRAEFDARFWWFGRWHGVE